MDENAGGAVVTSVATENATSVTVDEDNEERFEVADGNLKLKEGQKLDFESDTSPIEVVITASGDGESDTHTVSVSVNDVNEAPAIDVAGGAEGEDDGAATAAGITASFSVAENSGDAVEGAAGAILGLITLSDPDVGDTHTVAVSGDQADKFQVISHPEGDEGRLWLTLKPGQSLDFEEAAEVKLTLTVTDSGTPAESTPSEEVTIKVTDVNEAPTIAVADGTAASSTVDENAAGALLGEISLSDPDAGQTHTVVVSGAGSERFEPKQDAQGGWWLKLKDGESLDYEEESADDDPTIKLTLTVTDSGTPAMTDTAEVTITVNGVNEAPEAKADAEIPDATFVSGEEGSMEVDLKALFSDDPDGDTLKYALSDNAPRWLELSWAFVGDKITGTISGTPPDGESDVREGVSIVASDGDDDLDPALSAASFDVVWDAENAKPTEVYLRVTAADGQSDRVSEVPVKENDKGAVLGRLYVTDDDDARHPHGQHDFTFEVGGKKDDRFEVVGGMLKLKGDESDGEALDFEKDGNVVLKVTATDNKGGKDRLSVSTEITIKVGDLKAAEGEGPVANREIGDWWVTADNNLRSEDVGAGDWLSFRLQTAGPEAAFTDADGDTLTYPSVQVTGADGAVVDWLQINKTSGEITNKAKALPERGVYTVTVTAMDDDNNEAKASFELAVALSDVTTGVDGRRGNDGARISVLTDSDYTEGSSDEVVVASFSVDDDDIAIDPHPYGLLHVDFKATQTDDDGKVTNVKDSLKLVEVSRDGTAVNYEIRAKSAEDRAKGADGPDKDSDPDVYPKDHKDEGEVKPVAPLDFENGDRVEITVRVWDNLRYQEVDGELKSKPYVFDSSGNFEPLADDNFADERVTTFNIVDADDDAPMFVPKGVYKTQTMTLADKDRDPKTATTTIEVDQESRTVIVVRLEAAWEDKDTRDRDLNFEVDSAGLDENSKKWITVYGPGQWDDIQARSKRVGEEVIDADRPSGLGNREEVVVIVVDREAGEGANDFPGGGKLPSFTLTASDGAKRTTETISIKVVDTNVPIADADKDKVVTIVGDPSDPSGTGPLTMDVKVNLDPDLGGPGDALLVVYTWSHDPGTPGNDADDTVILVSSGTKPQPLSATMLAAVPDGRTVIATVQYYEIDPETKGIGKSESYSDRTDPKVARVAAPDRLDVFFELETDATGLTGTIMATGDAVSATGRAILQSRTREEDTWNNVANVAADTSSGPATVDLDVDADGRSTTTGDGGGLLYQVVYEYSVNGQTRTKTYDVGRLSDLNGGNPASATPQDIFNAAPGTPVPVNTPLLINTEGNAIHDVQWQRGRDVDSSGTIELDEWKKIDAAKGLTTLTVTGTEAGHQVRAKVAYKADDDTATAVDESDWIVWIDYTEAISVSAAANVPPLRTHPTEEIRVNITQTGPEDNRVSVDGSGSGSVAGKFVDLNSGDNLTYTLVADDIGNSPSDFAAPQLMPGNTVYVSGDLDSGATGDQTQTLAIDSDGNITYYTNSVTAHDATSTDGTGNTLVFDVNANDGTGDSAEDVTVTVRINVSPTAIEVSSSPLGETEAAATTIAPTATINETASTTTAQVTSVGVLASLDVQDLNLVTDDYGTHDVTVLTKKGKGFVEDARFEVTPTGGGRTDSDNNGSTWEIRLKEGQEFDFESKDNPMGVVTFKVTATDGGEHSVDAYFKMTLIDNVAPTPAPPAAGSGNKNPGDPQYEKPSGGGGSSDPDPKNPESTEGLRDDDRDENMDQDGDSEDGPAIEPPKDGGAFIDEDDLIGLAIDDDLLGDFVLAIDDGIDIA
ncbi:MAG: Ig-like domain-containing protein [Gammaproteobacteria bacterium]|nr:Ig-like domain-containing protein [Gammaproteobacteria bacterium]